LPICVVPTWAQTSDITPRDIDLLPPDAPAPEQLPDLPDNPNDLLPPPVLPEAPAVSPELLETTFFVTRIRFENNEIFDREALTEEVLSVAGGSSSGWTPQDLTIAELLELAQVISDRYAEAGYTASGALVRIPPETQANGRGEVIFDIQEGAVESVAVTGTQRLKPEYVRDRLGVAEGQPLNVTQLQENLQLLQLNPLIDQVRAEVSQGTTATNSQITVAVIEARAFDVSLGLNNSRPVSVGTTQQQVFVTQANLLGFGDAVNVGYSRTEGSDSLSGSYQLPLGSNGATVGFSYSPGWNDIIDPDFFDINRDGIGPDIQSESETYEIRLRYPLIRTIQDQTYQEFSLSLTGTLRDSRSFLLEEPFPLSPGASIDGKTRVAALRIGQDYSLRDAVQVLAVRSQFNVGIDAFNSTINNAIPGVETIPDSQFFSWLGQMQWVRVLAPETVLVLRSNMQLANQALLSSEQFGIGGFGSVRGYRQDRLLTDNGVLASAEVRLPIARLPEWQSTLQIVPFMDFGTGWNSAGRDPDPNTLAAVGAGLQWQTSDTFTARLDVGIPIIDAGPGGDTWQENGLTLSVVYTPF
jgi:hemolysin activation/secretion protein